MIARGPFDVILTPQSSTGDNPEPTLGRMLLDKTFHGDLEATSMGEMLTAGTSTTGSAAYVAVERVTGTLHGRKGSFSLHHTGIMTRGAPDLSIRVVPDSGDGELAGLTGTLAIQIEAGKHAYEFTYTLPGAAG